MKTLPYDVGQVWCAPCAFVIETYNADSDIEWTEYRPGARFEDEQWTWDAEGLEVRHIHAIVEIPKHARRVIYTRRWKPYDHPMFGKQSLKMTAVGAFSSWVNGTLGSHRLPAFQARTMWDLRAIEDLKKAA